jgi:hypothetical protein
MTTASPIVLEPAAQQVADAFSKPPFLYDMTPADARKVLEDAQSARSASSRSTKNGSRFPPKSETCGCAS